MLGHVTGEFFTHKKNHPKSVAKIVAKDQHVVQSRGESNNRIKIPAKRLGGSQAEPVKTSMVELTVRPLKIGLKWPQKAHESSQPTIHFQGVFCCKFQGGVPSYTHIFVGRQASRRSFFIEGFVTPQKPK